MPADTENPGAGLAFTDNISIDWKPVEKHPDDALLALVNASNEAFLRAVSAIGSFATEPTEDGAGLSQEVVRLELKMNLLLELVSQLVYKQLEIPERTRVTVSSNDIHWSGPDVPQPGEVIFVQVYIQHGTPKPLCFYGEVISSESEYDAGEARVRYLGLGGSAQSWLDKLIFRHHRRAVAFEKTKNTAD